ncbi:hypothetical protein ACWDPF_27760 [Streptomyces albogriseolus]
MSARTSAQRAAYARWQVKRRQLKKLGQWQPFVDAEPVREHLRKVNALGMPYYEVSKQVGLAQENSIQYLMWGRGPYGPGRQVRRETAELIMSYWPSLEDFPDTARIDSTGTRRRVQALATLGWSRSVIGERIGMRSDNFRKALGRDRVTAQLARKVAAVYDELWDQDPLTHGVSKTSVERTRADAVRAGWASPLAWDDDTIDDPAAVPQTDAGEPIVSEGGNLAARWLMGEAVVLGRDDRREVLQHLFEWTNHTTEEIAARLDMSPEAAERQWHRIKEKAAVEGRRVWRRVYVRRDINQNEMEEAA